MVTASAVQALRQRTWAGMMDCKQALQAVGGNEEQAIAWLRQKGLSAAAKRASRTASQGRIAIAINGGTGTIIELSCETDFVAKTPRFERLAQAIAEAPETAETLIPEAILELGEDIVLRRSSTISGPKVSGYAHPAAQRAAYGLMYRGPKDWPSVAQVRPFRAREPLTRNPL